MGGEGQAGHREDKAETNATKNRSAQAATDKGGVDEGASRHVEPLSLKDAGSTGRGRALRSGRRSVASTASGIV